MPGPADSSLSSPDRTAAWTDTCCPCGGRTARSPYDRETSHTMTISRRTFLAAAAAAGATAGAGLLSACGSGTPVTTGPNGAATSLEVFSWWTAGGELQALDALK